MTACSHKVRRKEFGIVGSGSPTVPSSTKNGLARTTLCAEGDVFRRILGRPNLRGVRCQGDVPITHFPLVKNNEPADRGSYVGIAAEDTWSLKTHD